MGSHCLSLYLILLSNVSKDLQQTKTAGGIFKWCFCWRLMFEKMILLFLC